VRRMIIEQHENSRTECDGSRHYLVTPHAEFDIGPCDSERGLRPPIVRSRDWLIFWCLVGLLAGVLLMSLRGGPW